MEADCYELEGFAIYLTKSCMSINPMGEITFWKLNKKRTIVLLAISIVLSYFLFIRKAMENIHFEVSLIFSFVPLVMVTLVFIGPAINCFKVIRRLITDTSECSILPFFDSEYSIKLEDEKSLIFFATPYIDTTISGLPVKIRFNTSSKNSWSYLSIEFRPLGKEGSNDLFSKTIEFKMYLRKRLLTDVKPEILKFISDLKSAGYKLYADREISSVHFDPYAPQF
jgi:hypothetical protein